MARVWAPSQQKLREIDVGRAPPSAWMTDLAIAVGYGRACEERSRLGTDGIDHAARRALAGRPLAELRDGHARVRELELRTTISVIGGSAVTKVATLSCTGTTVAAP